MGSDGRAWHGGRVLVCEDNLLMAEVVCEFLRECGLEPIGPAGRLENGMQLARERGLDGAILDISLRGQLCFPICSILSARRVPLVFLTGYGDQGGTNSCRVPRRSHHLQAVPSGRVEGGPRPDAPFAQRHIVN